MGRRSVIVVGGGPAGLAVAAACRRRGLHATVLDRGERIGASWAERYDRLHLHTPRIQSHLPGYPIPRRYGRWVGRDDLVRYLADYARTYGIQPVLGVEVERIERGLDDDGWSVVTSDGTRHAGRVVIATGYNATPWMPPWPGTESFRGHLLHASHYRRPGPFAGQRVLVVGTGNTGAEIATDLATSDASEVLLSIRTPPHVIPRSVLGLPVTLIGIINEQLPPRLTDPISWLLARLTIGDLRPYGLPRPTIGLAARHRRDQTIPLIDVGLVDQLRAGRVRVVPEVVGFDDDHVLLGRGTSGTADTGGTAGTGGANSPPERVAVDTVLAATGYRTGLERLVGHLGVLDAHGRPVVTGPRTHPHAPDLYFVGLRNPLSGLLLSIRRDAVRVSRALARSSSGR